MRAKILIFAFIGFAGLMWRITAKPPDSLAESAVIMLLWIFLLTVLFAAFKAGKAEKAQLEQEVRQNEEEEGGPDAPRSAQEKIPVPPPPPPPPGQDAGKQPDTPPAPPKPADKPARPPVPAEKLPLPLLLVKLVFGTVSPDAILILIIIGFFLLLAGIVIVIGIYKPGSVRSNLDLLAFASGIMALVAVPTLINAIVGTQDGKQPRAPSAVSFKGLFRGAKEEEEEEHAAHVREYAREASVPPPAPQAAQEASSGQNTSAEAAPVDFTAPPKPRIGTKLNKDLYLTADGKPTGYNKTSWMNTFVNYTIAALVYAFVVMHLLSLRYFRTSPMLSTLLIFISVVMTFYFFAVLLSQKPSRGTRKKPELPRNDKPVLSIKLKEHREKPKQKPPSPPISRSGVSADFQYLDPAKSFEGHASRVTSAYFLEDKETIISSSEDGSVRIWDTQTTRQLRKFDFGAPVHSLAVSPCKKLAAAGIGAKTALIFRISDGRPQRALDGHTYPVKAIAFSPDGTRVATGSWDEKVMLWDTASSRLLAKGEAHSNWVNAVAFSPSGELLASVSHDNSLILWNAADLTMVRDVKPKADCIYYAAFSPSGKELVLACGNNNAITCNVRDGSTGASYEGARQLLLHASFSLDGKFILAGGRDSLVFIWDHNVGKMVAALKGHDSAVKAVSLSSDGKLALTSGDDKTIRLWDMRPLLASSPSSSTATDGLAYGIREPATSLLSIRDSSGGTGQDTHGIENFKEPAGGTSVLDIKETVKPPAVPPPPPVRNDPPTKDRPYLPADYLISKPGDLVDGKYRVVREIGRGGMAIVFEAHDISLDRRVALKRMRDEVRISKREKMRFVDEARTTAKMRHQNIVNIYTIIDDGENVFLVFEYIDGKTLAEMLDIKGKFPLAESIAVSKQVLKALDYAHANKVIHRDLKPSNIMVAQDGYVRVTDFGIARFAKDSATKLTGSADISGTMAYMAPEQELGRSDEQSDIFSFGVTLYEILTGRLPFEGPNFLAQKQASLYTPLRQFSPEIPERLEKIVALCLEPKRDQRYKTAAAVLKDIKTIPW